MGWYKEFLKRVAHFQVQHPIMTLLILGAVTIMIAGGLSSVKTVASLEQMMPPDEPAVKAFNELRDAGLGQDIIAIVIQVEPDTHGVQTVLDPQVHAYLKHLTNVLADEPDIITTRSYAELGDLSTPLAQGQLPQYVNSDQTITLMLLTTDVAADDTRMLLLVERVQDIIETAGHPPGTVIKLTGTPVIQQRLGEMITADRTNTSWMSTLFVFLITALIFMSISTAIVPIIVVTTSVLWLYGTMGYTGLPISTLAGGVAAMVIGIGIDFAIHIINKFKYERKKGCSISRAVECAVVDTGTALTATSLTTSAAFLAFLFGAMPEMGRFGLLMTIGIGYALLFSVFGLPALLILEEKIIYAIKKKAHFGLEKEFHLEAGK